MPADFWNQEEGENFVFSNRIFKKHGPPKMFPFEKNSLGFRFQVWHNPPQKAGNLQISLQVFYEG